jgi:type I restriction enzyme M protein
LENRKIKVDYEMFEQTFKNIDDILHKDAGCGSEWDYADQTP